MLIVQGIGPVMALTDITVDSNKSAKKDYAFSSDAVDIFNVETLLILLVTYYISNRVFGIIEPLQRGETRAEQQHHWRFTLYIEIIMNKNENHIFGE